MAEEEFRDPAILSMDASVTFRTVSCLPKEMVAYELESQGQKAYGDYNDLKKRLTSILKSGSYKIGKYHVALGPKEDIAICTGHLNKWSADLKSITPLPTNLESYSTKVTFLSRRIELIEPTDTLRLEYLTLKALHHHFKDHIKRLQLRDEISHLTLSQPGLTPLPEILRNIESWNFDESTEDRKDPSPAPSEASKTFLTSNSQINPLASMWKGRSDLDDSIQFMEEPKGLDKFEKLLDYAHEALPTLLGRLGLPGISDDGRYKLKTSIQELMNRVSSSWEKETPEFQGNAQSLLAYVNREMFRKEILLSLERDPDMFVSEAFETFVDAEDRILSFSEELLDTGLPSDQRPFIRNLLADAAFQLKSIDSDLIPFMKERIIELEDFLIQTFFKSDLKDSLDKSDASQTDEVPPSLDLWEDESSSFHLNRLFGEIDPTQ